jgi:hypothetical protein
MENKLLNALGVQGILVAILSMCLITINAQWTVTAFQIIAIMGSAILFTLLGTVKVYKNKQKRKKLRQKQRQQTKTKTKRKNKTAKDMFNDIGFTLVTKTDTGIRYQNNDNSSYFILFTHVKDNVFTFRIYNSISGVGNLNNKEATKKIIDIDVKQYSKNLKLSSAIQKQIDELEWK